MMAQANVIRTPIETPAAWRAADVAAAGNWLRRLTEPEIEDLITALLAVRASGKSLLQLTRQHVRLGAFAPAPIYSLRDGHFTVRYIRNHIRASQPRSDTPRLTGRDHPALDIIQDRGGFKGQHAGPEPRAYQARAAPGPRHARHTLLKR
jgi:hypothetical protein